MKKSIVVIGGGPAGYEAALSCGRAGLDTTLIEKNNLGGVCVNTGCIPTRIYLQALKTTGWLWETGISKAEKLDQLNKLKNFAQDRIQQTSFGIAYLLEKSGVKICRAEAVDITCDKVRLDDGCCLPYDELIVATGSEAAPAEGICCHHMYSAEELLSLENLPEEIHVIGGGVLGVELSVILQAAGVRVTVCEKEDHLLPGWDREIQDVMTAQLKQRNIEVVTGSHKESFERCVLCAGRRPILPPFAGDVAQSEKVHIIGDARGFAMRADLAAREGRAIAERLLSETVDAPEDVHKTDLQAVRCIFTPLEAASTGILTDRDPAALKESYYGADMSACGMIFATHGAFAKAVMEKDTHILRGFHMMSALASETIQTGRLAIAKRMTAEEFLQNTAPHPTEGELLTEAVRRLL